MKFSLPYLYRLLFPFSILLFLLSCQQQSPIKIGLSINLSGRGGAAGEHIRDGALLAVDEINNDGGINGRPLELLIRDDQNNDAGVKKADESLVEEGVVAIIGHSYSSNTLKAYPFVTSHDTLLITAYTATTELSGRDDMFFRTSVDCTLYGKKMAALLKKNAQSVVFLMDMTNAAFVKDYANSVKDHFSGTIREVQFESREPADWTSIIDELLSSQPDAIVLLTEASMTGVALQKLKAAGYGGDTIGSIWTQTPGLMRHAGNSAEGLSLVTFIDPDNNLPAFRDFSKQIKERFHKNATARSTRAYEIVMILADALRRSAHINSTELKKALLAGRYNTLMGQLKFDQYGDVVRPVYEVIVQGKQFRNNGEI